MCERYSMCACMCIVHVHVCAGLEEELGILHYPSMPYSFETGSSTETGTRLVASKPQRPSCLCPSTPGTDHAWLLHGC